MVSNEKKKCQFWIHRIKKRRIFDNFEFEIKKKTTYVFLRKKENILNKRKKKKKKKARIQHHMVGQIKIVPLSVTINF